MTITLTRGQMLLKLFSEASATAEALTLFLRQRYAIGAYIPDVKVEGDLIQVRIEETEVAQTNDEYQRIDVTDEKGRCDEEKKLVFGVITKGTALSEVLRVIAQMSIDPFSHLNLCVYTRSMSIHDSFCYRGEPDGTQFR